MRYFTSTELVFTHLSKVNPTTGKNCQGINLPRTLLLRHKTPFSYFTIDSRHRLHRQQRDKSSLRTFYNQVTQLNSGIVAVQYDSNLPITRDLMSSMDLKKGLVQQIKPVYLDGSALSKMFELLPDKSELLGVTLTSSIIYSALKRSTHCLPGGMVIKHHHHLLSTKRNLVRISNAVKTHISEVSSQTFDIKRMKLMFQISKDSKYYLIGVNQLVLFSKKPDRFRSIQNTVFSRPQVRYQAKSQSLTCLNCRQTVSSPCSLEMRHVVESFKKNLAGKSWNPQELKEVQRLYRLVIVRSEDSNESQDKIIMQAIRRLPTIVLKMNGYITFEKYLACTKSPSWLASKCSVCHQCYFQYTKYLQYKPSLKKRSQRASAKQGLRNSSLFEQLQVRQSLQSSFTKTFHKNQQKYLALRHDRLMTRLKRTLS